jgi:hypothetical protein
VSGASRHSADATRSSAASTHSIRARISRRPVERERVRQLEARVLARALLDFAADVRTLYAAAGSPDKRPELVPGALHGVFLVDASAAVRSLLERFIRDPRAATRT